VTAARVTAARVTAARVKARPRQTPAQAQARLERALVRVMMAPDPGEALQRAARDPGLPAPLRRALEGASPDGVRTAALLVAKLRFERLVRGSLEAEAWFERDAAGFAAAFRRYHAEVAPRAFFPPAEARLFAAWLARR
jgi:hypothetical protein